MIRQYMRLIFVVTVSAGLMAPAQAYDVSAWFNGLSKNSKNTLYVTTAALVAGLSLLAYKMWTNPEKVIVPRLDLPVELPFEGISEDAARRGLEVQRVRDEQQREKEQKAAQQRLLEDASLNLKVEQQAKRRDQHALNTKNAREVKNKLGQLRAAHTSLETTIKEEMAKYSSDMDAMSKQLVMVQKTYQKEQEEQVVSLVRSLSNATITDFIRALETRNYSEITASYRPLFTTIWTEKTRLFALAILKAEQTKIEEAYKRKQARKEAELKKEQEKRKAHQAHVQQTHAQVDDVFDREAERQAAAKQRKARPKVNKPVKRVA